MGKERKAVQTFSFFTEPITIRETSLNTLVSEADTPIKQAETNTIKPWESPPSQAKRRKRGKVPQKEQTLIKPWQSHRWWDPLLSVDGRQGYSLVGIHTYFGYAFNRQVRPSLIPNKTLRIRPWTSRIEPLRKRSDQTDWWSYYKPVGTWEPRAPLLVESSILLLLPRAMLTMGLVSDNCMITIVAERGFRDTERIGFLCPSLFM